MSTDLITAIEDRCECTDTDFKARFGGTAAAWLELIKDIVAIANSGGGVIFIGIDDNGELSDNDLAIPKAIDPADITDKVFSYTGVHYAGARIRLLRHHGGEVVAIEIGAAQTPLVFTRPGTYAVDGGNQKTAFARGSVYFRHGAKSEPGTTDDLRDSLEREINRRKDAWLEGIARIIEAPSGSRVAILPAATEATGPSGAVPLRLTDDPAAPSYFAVPLDQTHPFRQKEVVREVNTRLRGQRFINSHDVVCIRRVFEIQREIVFCYTQNFASPRYSEKFVDWIVRQYASDPQFFDKTRAAYDELKASAQPTRESRATTRSVDDENRLPS